MSIFAPLSLKSKATTQPPVIFMWEILNDNLTKFDSPFTSLLTIPHSPECFILIVDINSQLLLSKILAG